MAENTFPEGVTPAGRSSAPKNGENGEKTAPTATVCPRCGASLTPGGRFCTVCGLSLETVRDWYAPDAPDGPDTSVASGAPGMGDATAPDPSAPADGAPGDSGAASESRPSPAPRPVNTAYTAPVRPSFSASWREILAAACMYLLAWWYLFQADLFLDGPDTRPERIWALVFVLGFVGLTEWLHWERRRPRESWFWLGCLALVTAGLLLGRDSVWGIEQHVLFLHLTAVWWLLCRSGTLVEGRTDRLLPLDAVDGFIVFPFYHFFLRIRCLFYALRQPFRNRRKIPGETLLFSGLALLCAVVLFAVALQLLTKADAGFDVLMGRVADWFRLDWDPSEFFLKLLLSLPVGAYLFGLIAGSRREDPEILRERGRGLLRWVESLRKVPDLVWTGLTAVFCLLYLLFFAVQSSYLFGAFTRTLPEGFIVSQYAREGFFELCKVMALNFALLWLVTRSSRTPVRQRKGSLAVCVVLLVESMLFAVVAFSKLALYIDCFGFTPLRLQSTWLVCVLFLGCAAALWSLFTGKKSFRPWVFASAASLCLLCLW